MFGVGLAATLQSPATPRVILTPAVVVCSLASGEAAAKLLLFCGWAGSGAAFIGSATKRVTKIEVPSHEQRG